MMRRILALSLLAPSGVGADQKGEENVVLVTGSASGIGKASAEKFAREGWIVYGGDIDTERNRHLSEIGGVPLKMDISSGEQVHGAVRRILAERGRIDLLVANAAYLQLGTIECVPIEAAQRQFDVNVFGTVRCIQAVLPSMRERGEGRIVVVSSAVGTVALPAAGWYPASKHALESLCDSLRMEVERFGIEVSIVAPGMTDTRFFENARPTLDRALASPHAPVYASEHENVQTNWKRAEDRGYPAERIAATVWEAATAVRPKTRYRPGFKAIAAVAGDRWLGDRAMDRILRRKFLGPTPEP